MEFCNENSASNGSHYSNPVDPYNNTKVSASLSRSMSAPLRVMDNVLETKAVTACDEVETVKVGNT